ncbi:CLUMA_CG004042, isoform A [Clunio marinus]|uniref:CLUMA_CG004042, isoform A n=1 Tax=Clunio marinus TaxID=568069 RepID=A0A1J1HW12_9DIPT|nr:CLUMA_CG004042, isoform A [Clunio marinus]
MLSNESLNFPFAFFLFQRSAIESLGKVIFKRPSGTFIPTGRNFVGLFSEDDIHEWEIDKEWQDVTTITPSFCLSNLREAEIQLMMTNEMGMKQYRYETKRIK